MGAVAKRRAAPRTEKRVLANQTVKRSSRPASSASPQRSASSPGRRYVREILGVFAFVGAIGLLCALWTFRRGDGAGGEVHNAIGPAGHHIAWGFFSLFGLCAYLVPVAIFYTSMALFVHGRGKHRLRQVAGLVALALSGAVLGHLLIGPSHFSYPPGGAVGAALGEGLRSLFSAFGAVLLMSATAAGALIIATDSAFARLCVRVGGWVRSGALVVGAFGLAAAKRAWQAYLERRERKRRERLEEEAALAQALADAEDAGDEGVEAEAPFDGTPAENGAAEEVAPEDVEELEPGAVAPVSDEEWLASEADAVAEEAARLAGVAEAKRLREEDERRASEAALRVARRARNLPAADPAWAMAAPVAAAAATAEAAPALAAPVEPEEKARPRPVISMPPEPPAPEKHAELAPEAEPSAAAAAAGSAAASSPALPLIVEPKAPPKPSKPEKKDPFAFEGSSHFSLPPLSLLEQPSRRKQALDKEVFFTTAEKLREKLASFGIEGQVKEIRPGPVVTMYEFEPAPGIKISKIASLADDLAMAMEALKVRIVAPIPGKGVVGIEVPNKTRETVLLREIVEQDAFLKSTSKLAMAIGKNIEGMPYVADLSKMPHLLIAGTTGSGKSVSVNAMIMSFLFKATPEEVRLIMVDPKVTELSIYEGIPHLLLPVVTDARKAALALRWAVEEMERRYQLLAEAGVRNIAGYNKWVERVQNQFPAPVEPPATIEKTTASGSTLRIIDVAEGESEEDARARLSSAPAGNARELAVSLEDEPELPFELTALTAGAPSAAPAKAAGEKPKKLPYIVIIIDEVADLMMVAAREVETYVARLAQMARAAGVHLMVATQRPSTDVITGVIKANFPTRVSFQLRSKPDSMTILGTVGAESLLGMGDMLILPPTSAHLERVHGAFVSDQEIQRVVAHLKTQGKPVYDESILRPRDEDGDDGGGEPEEYADEMYDQCLALIADMRQVSVSMLQRKLRLGYNRAARIIERMEREGVVGPANGSKPREVLIRPVGEMQL